MIGASSFTFFRVAASQLFSSEVNNYREHKLTLTSDVGPVRLTSENEKGIIGGRRSVYIFASVVSC